MSQADRIRPWMFKPGESGNPSGRKPKPRRSFNAVQRLEALGVDPLEEAIALAQDPTLPKVARLKAWLDLMNYCYPKIAPVVPHETVSATLAELQRSWDARTLDELKETFRKEINTLPAEVRRELEKLVAKSGFDPLVIETLLKFRFVEQRTESQAQAQDPQDPEQPGLKVV
jgi:hypothetical protein